MELRKDPITRSWVITGDDVPEPAPRPGPCSLCSDAAQLQVIATLPGLDGSPWSARAIVHPAPIYRIEGEPGRRGDGLYDRMGSVGAHELLLENFHHDRHLWNASDAEIEQFLRLMAQRIQDLKLVPSGGGCFELSVNGELIYSKLQTGQFPDEQAMLAAVVAELMGFSINRFMHYDGQNQKSSETR